VLPWIISTLHAQSLEIGTIVQRFTRAGEVTAQLEGAIFQWKHRPALPLIAGRFGQMYLHVGVAVFRGDAQELLLSKVLRR